MGRDRIKLLPLVGTFVLLASVSPRGAMGADAQTADDPVCMGQRWNKLVKGGSYSFRGTVVENEDISGIATISDGWGLVGSDETRLVQLFRLSNESRRMMLTESQALLNSGDEIDIEAIAAEKNLFYVTGSHGVSKKKGKVQDNRFKMFRITLDTTSGRAVLRDLRTATLSHVLASDGTLGRYFNKPLQHSGVNIEGLAARDGRLFVGLRNPSVEGHAFVLEVRADDVFSSAPNPSTTLHKLRLGTGYGLREIVPTRAGFLVLAGNAGSEPSDKYPKSQNFDPTREFVLFHWDGRTPDVQRIGSLSDPPGKAEAILVVQEQDAEITVLILFDGPAGGAPTVYHIRCSK